MFDAVRNNKRIVQVFLGLITLPFAFWGVDSYMSNIGAGNDLASVGDSKISLYQFEQSLRERQDQLRRSMGAEFKPEMMNLPEVRLGILNNLIDQRLLLLEASDKRLRVSDQALQQFIANIPSFQEDGKFSPSRYEALVRAQSKSPAQFEGELRQDLTLQQLIGSVSASAFVSTTQAEQMLRIQTEERHFSEFKIATAPFAEKLKIEPEAVQKFYDENKVRFEVPEQVKAEYVVLSLEALLPQVTVSEAEINSWINNESNKDRYQQLLVQKPEERRASHILITPDGDAKDGKEKARAKAEDVLKDVQKDPSRFAELARQYSQDPGSAQQGGDLGFFSRGMMVKPFEDAVFSQKKGEISGLVESDFGYHIIKLTDIQEAKERPQQEVRIEIETELKRQTASRQFAEAAENFNNLVYEQSDSLQPAADKFKLEIQKTDWVPKNADAQARVALGVLNNDKVLSALFSEDAIKNQRNTEAFEVASNTLVSARVVEHVAATIQAFETVRDDIEKHLKDEEAMKQARTDGEARLAEFEKGEDKIAWPEARGMSRLQSRESQLPLAALQAIFKADVQKLPAYVGVVLDDSYSLFKITQVVPPEKVDEDQLKALKDEYAGILSREDFSAYLSSLRSRYKIDINMSLLERGDR